MAILYSFRYVSSLVYVEAHNLIISGSGVSWLSVPGNRENLCISENLGFVIILL